MNRIIRELLNKWVVLSYTEHALNRAKDRLGGLIILPKQINITENNICSIKFRRKRIKSVLINLKYNNNTYICMAINPYKKEVLTLWFEDEKNAEKRRNKKTNGVFSPNLE